MGIVAPTKENMNAMLAKDKQVFTMLVTYNIWLFRRPENLKSPQYQATLDLYNAELRKYALRQNDYKNNTLYKISNSVTEFKDKVVNYFSDLGKKLFSGMGDGGIITVPVAIAIGATLSVVAIGYFVAKYYTETNSGYNALIKMLPSIQQSDPELAKSIVAGVGKQAQAEAESGFFSQLGQGAKIFLTVAGIGVVGFSGYKIYQATSK